MPTPACSKAQTPHHLLTLPRCWSFILLSHPYGARGHLHGARDLCPHHGTSCSLFKGRFCLALGAVLQLPFGPRISSLGRWKWVRAQVCLQAWLWCSALSGIPDLPSDQGQHQEGKPLVRDHGAQGHGRHYPCDPQIRGVSSTGRHTRHVAPPQSHMTTVAPGSAQTTAQPHRGQSPHPAKGQSAPIGAGTHAW